VDAWNELHARLESLPRLRPHEGFANRVMADVTVPARQSRIAKIGWWIRDWFGAGSHAHPSGHDLQDLVEGALKGRRAARTRSHLESCESCGREAERWADTLRALDSLPRFAPGTEFEDLVMARVRVPARAVTTRPATVGARDAVAASGQRLVGAITRWAPRSGRTWAAMAGAAVTPAVIFGLVVYTVFSSSALTPGALVSYGAWQVGDLLAAAWELGMNAVVETAGALGLSGAWGAAPVTVFAAAAAYSLAVLLATRVLYRNLVSSHSASGIDHVQLSRS